MERRSFIKTSGIGAGALALSTQSAFATQSALAAQSGESAAKPNDRLPREVWVATLSMEGLKENSIDRLLDRLLERMEETAACQPDIVCVPETFLFPGVSHSLPVAEIAEESPGPITSRFAKFSKAHNCYAICPIHTKQNGVIYNSAVLIGRDGEIESVYNKLHPTTGEMESGTCPGALGQSAVKTDFGSIGMQICFDVNWTDGWRPLKQDKVDIIFWPSAFAGGRMLNGWAWNTQSHIVTSAWNDPSRIIDITGDEITSTGRYDHWICAPLNLEKAMIHTWPYEKPINALREKYKQGVRVRRLHDEGWTVIESRVADVPVADMLAEFDIPLHRDHIAKADQAQKAYRSEL